MAVGSSNVVLPLMLSCPCGINHAFATGVFVDSHGHFVCNQCKRSGATQLNLAGVSAVGFVYPCGCIMPFQQATKQHQCPRIRPLQLGQTLNIGPAYLTDVAWAHNDFSHVYLAAPIGSADPIVLVKRTTFEWGKVVQIGVAHPATFPDKQFKSKVRIWPELDIDSKVLAMSPTKHVTYDWRALADVGIPESAITFMLRNAGACNRSRWPWLNLGEPRCTSGRTSDCIVVPTLYQPTIDGKPVLVNEDAVLHRTSYLDVICLKCERLHSEDGFAQTCAAFCAPQEPAQPP